MNVKKVLMNVLLMPVVITLLEDIIVHVTLDMRVMALLGTAAVSFVLIFIGGMPMLSEFQALTHYQVVPASSAVRVSLIMLTL